MTRLPCELKRWWLLRLMSDSEISTQLSPEKRSWLPKRFQKAGLEAAQGADQLSQQSRVQQRLDHPIGRDRLFLRLMRRRRSRPNKLNQTLNSIQFRERLWRRAILALLLSASTGAVVWSALFVTERVTLGGVPYRIVRKFYLDKSSRNAYFAGDSQALHDRLSAIGIENDIKDYYRPQFSDEGQLDLHIHQIMFDRTGYVGEAYAVNKLGQLYVAGYSPQGL